MRRKSDHQISSFLHCCDSLIDLHWFHFEIVSFRQNELRLQQHFFRSSLIMKYILRIRSKSVITTFPSGMHIFRGCYWDFSFLIKVVYSCGIVFRKSKYLPIRFWSKRNRKLTFSRCYTSHFFGIYVWSISIMHDSWKMLRRLLQFSFLKFIIALYIIITIHLICYPPEVSIIPGLIAPLNL